MNPPSVIVKKCFGLHFGFDPGREDTVCPCFHSSEMASWETRSTADLQARAILTAVTPVQPLEASQPLIKKHQCLNQSSNPFLAPPLLAEGNSSKWIEVIPADALDN